MSDLPSRERVADLGCTAGSPEEADDIEAILNAYRLSELMTATEWRKTIDYEAAAERYVELNLKDYGAALTPRDKATLIKRLRPVVDAAIGDTDSTVTSADWFNRDDNI